MILLILLHAGGGGVGRRETGNVPFSTGIPEHISLLLSEFSGTGLSPSVFHALAFLASLEGEGQGDGPALPHRINQPYECPQAPAASEATTGAETRATSREVTFPTSLYHKPATPWETVLGWCLGCGPRGGALLWVIGGKPGRGKGGGIGQGKIGTRAVSAGV